MRSRSGSASRGWIQTGLVWAISSSHLAFPLRVWIWTGTRNVEIRTIWPGSRRSGWTWLGMYVGTAYSGQPQSARVAE